MDIFIDMMLSNFKILRNLAKHDYFEKEKIIGKISFNFIDK